LTGPDEIARMWRFTKSTRSSTSVAFRRRRSSTAFPSRETAVAGCIAYLRDRSGAYEQ
jgi:hypothetical protein